MTEEIIKKVKEVWDRDFDLHISPWYMTGYKISDWQLLEGLPLQEMNCLNIGSSYPIDAINIGWRFREFIESDFSREIVEKMRNIYEEVYPQSFMQNVFFEMVDATNIQYVDKNFDIVLAYSSIDHIPEALKAIAEICRIAKKYVCITLPNWYDEYNREFSEAHPERFGYEKYWTPQELIRIMLEHNFIPIKYNNNENRLKGNRFGYLFERAE